MMHRRRQTARTKLPARRAAGAMFLCLIFVRHGVPAAAAAAPTPRGPPSAPAAGENAGAIPPAGLERQVDEAALEPGRAVAVKHVELSAGLAKLRLETGVLIPVTPAGGRTLELVFAGEGRIQLEPADAVGSAPLGLFTRRPRPVAEIGGAVPVGR